MSDHSHEENTVVENITEQIAKTVKQKNNSRGVIDIITEKAVSRKLLVWLTATVFLCLGKITPEDLPLVVDGL